jgi:hypothetical protein
MNIEPTGKVMPPCGQGTPEVGRLAARAEELTRERDEEVNRLANDLASDHVRRAERAERDAATWKQRIVKQGEDLREIIRREREQRERDRACADDALRSLRAGRTAEAEEYLHALAAARTDGEKS